jgi:exonuclease V gamma subunit
VDARQLARQVGKTNGGHALAVRAAACGVLVSTWMKGPASDRILRFEIDTDNLSAQSKLRAWIRHVVCNAAAGQEKRVHGTAPGIPVVTQIVMPSRTLTLNPLGDEALACLESLVEPFVRGHREPIPFFPKTSSELAKEVRKGPAKSDAERLEDARKRFQAEGWNGSKSEGDDPFIRLCWRGIDPFAEPWAEETLQLARSVFGPLQAYMTKGAEE